MSKNDNKGKDSEFKTYQAMLNIMCLKKFSERDTYRKKPIKSK